MYKKFFVSKSDSAKVAFLERAIEDIRPSSIYILCEPSRKEVYKGIDAVCMPLKNLNKTKEWITFVNTFDQNSLLVIDNVIKFLNYGDGKKKHLRVISQSLNNVLVMDVVPFYTEPYEIFYPFFFLDKSILGYNSYNSFKANHMEEKADGEIAPAHSFGVLKEKLKGFYQQDYSSFFVPREIIKWEMAQGERERYAEVVGNLGDGYSNPIKIMTKAADTVNLFQSKADVLSSLVEELNGAIAVVINILSYEKRIRGMMSSKKDITFKTFHDSDYTSFAQYDHVVFYDNIIVKPHNVFYIEPYIRGKAYCFLEPTSKIDQKLYERVYGSGLRDDFNQNFYV